MATKSYDALLMRRTQGVGEFGFEPLWLPDFLFDFQSHLVDWALRKGRAGTFADCGMGKTAMQLVWAKNVRIHTGKPVLILTPLAVAHQTAREAEKFDIEAAVSRDGKVTAPVVITNYERLHYFSCDVFGGVVCDESSALKNFDSARKKSVTDFMRNMPYRLLCTATAAPNDYHELGTSSEALGYLGYRDMITKFFKQEQNLGGLGFGRSKYRFRGHAEQPFWRWVCSWARAIRKPSDLGFDDSRFVLPELIEREHIVENSTPRKGMLFSVPARSMREEREERRISIDERCELVASMIPTDRPAVIWCHLNDEGDLLSKLIPDAEQVAGAMSDDEKEAKLAAFSDGSLRVLVTKPKIGCWGLNWQHCSDVYTFPSHSFEQYYQAVRRCWRFGQTNPVTVNIIATEGEAGISKNLQRKARQADEMFESIVRHMANEMAIERNENFSTKEELPAWL